MLAGCCSVHKFAKFNISAHSLTFSNWLKLSRKTEAISSRWYIKLWMQAVSLIQRNLQIFAFVICGESRIRGTMLICISWKLFISWGSRDTLEGIFVPSTVELSNFSSFNQLLLTFLILSWLCSSSLRNMEKLLNCSK